MLDSPVANTAFLTGFIMMCKRVVKELQKRLSVWFRGSKQDKPNTQLLYGLNEVPTIWFYVQGSLKGVHGVHV